MATHVQEQELSVQEASRLDPLFGQMIDSDGHLYLPVEVFEDMTRGLGAQSTLDFYKRFVGSAEYESERARNREDVFGVKGMAALGATDMEERLEALDLMGVRAQLAFPQTFGSEYRLDSDLARSVNQKANDYYLELCKQSKGRVWPAVSINMYDPKWAVEELERVLKIGGVGGINMSCATPPGGTSPAHSQWDPFWARIAEAGVPALIHLGSGGLLSAQDPDPMFPERAWGNAEFASRDARRTRRR
ncbi:MAG: amidohydrolase family protein [Sphingobium sp.]